ncbi:hypothetical protein [Streptomyces sp. SID13031]|uniref:hypothetical protein n=1 Tax=Streptomyces sp. SID13031 TaxID=2706046 RepID=UPI0013C6F6C4|nr:hypothetical protein [Streptomyces sp. SID13031]NEA36084.1 hypothetical protein [Streptomyces sp. SID13031]
MELDHYLESVRRSVENATALADDQTRSVAQRLGATLDDAGRLALISALSDAAGEISRELSPGSVELRMAGGRPEFVVTPAPSQLTGNDDDDLDDDVEPAAEELALDADEPTARITLRLPMSVKNKVDEAAAAEGISSNAWLMRTVMTSLAGRGGYGRPPGPPRPPRPGIFAPNGPLGPDGPLGPEGIFGKDGVFGPEGVFGPDGMFGDGRRGERGERRDERAERRGERERGRDRGPDHGQRRGGRGPGQRMQGWAQ